jgi:hypothetical protein
VRPCANVDPRCLKISAVATKEGGAPQDSARTTAESNAERPAACSGPSCEEVVGLPAPAEDAVKKRSSPRDPRTVRGRIKVEVLQGAVEEQAAKLLSEFITNEDFPVSRNTVDLSDLSRGALQRNLATRLKALAEKRELAQKVADISRLRSVEDVEKYTAGQLEVRQALLDGAKEIEFEKVGSPQNALIPLVSTLMKRSELKENLAIYNRIQRLEVVGGEVRYKAAFTATAE